MKKNINRNSLCFFLIVLFITSPLYAQPKIDRADALKVGNTIPNAKLERFGQPSIQVNDLVGKIKIISIVPQLNTPVCDKQTHQFSEKNDGLDKHIDIITISTNSSEGQVTFAQKAKINNLVFLSDNPNFDFGKKTGLLLEGMGMLRRTVLVADEMNVIRYVDFVPSGGLPDIKGALKAARKVLLEAS